MMRTKLLQFSLIMLCLSAPSYAQNWSGILDPNRAIDWSNAGIPGGIPNRTTICQTIAPYTGTADTINTAIQNCPSGQVVFLSAGTFNLSTGITFNDKSNVTLRGAGPDQTTLVFTGYDPCGGPQSDICVPNGHLNHIQAPGNTANWTSGYAKGTTVITISNTTNLQVGTLLSLDQENDPDTDTNEIWICSTTAVCSYEGPSGVGRVGSPRREQIQLVRVTAINGNNITISPGLYMPNWNANHNPGAWWSNDTPITGVGIEDLTLDHSNSGQTGGITFFNAYNGWVRNIKSVKANRVHVWFIQSAANIVRDSYFYETKVSASQSYGVEFFMTSDNLIENNIFHRVNTPLSNNGSAQGNVYAYNSAFILLSTNAPAYMSGTPLDHATGLSFNLYEGNMGNGLEADISHGPPHFLTSFRNRWTGFETGKDNNTHPVHLHAFARYYNFVGNVLGTAGYHDVYEDGASTGGHGIASIYFLGWSFTNPNPPHDILVKTTSLRWGNYDTLTGTSRFVAAEVPSGIAVYPNPVPANQNLPASFFLSAKPSWFGSVPWPPIGPDVTGGTGPGGHSYAIPSELCYTNTPRDGNGILLFNGDSCYGSTLPSHLPPTNLRVIGIQ